MPIKTRIFQEILKIGLEKTELFIHSLLRVSFEKKAKQITLEI